MAPETAPDTHPDTQPEIPRSVVTDRWQRYGHSLWRHAGRYLLFGLLLLLPLMALMPRLFAVIQGDGFEVGGENASSQQQLKQSFGVAVEPLLLLVTPVESGAVSGAEPGAETEPLSDEQFRDALLEWLVVLDGLALLSGQITPADNPDWLHGQQALLLLDPAGDSVVEENDNALLLLAQLEQSLALFQAEQGIRLQLAATGGGVIKQAIKETSQQDLLRAEMVALPLAFIVLLYAFGGILSALLALLAAALSILSTMGALYLVSHLMPLSIFVLNVTSLVGMAVSIDFALILISRLAAEYQRGARPLETALVTAIATAGRAIAFSALSVFIGLSGLLWFEINTFRSIAISGMVVVALSAMVALMLLPALLARTGHFLLTHSRDTSRTPAVIRRLVSFGIRWPLTAVLLTLVLIGAMIWPLHGSRLEMPADDALHDTHPASQARFAFQQRLAELNPAQAAGQSTQLELLAALPAPLTEPAGVQYLQQLSEALAQRDGVVAVQSLLSALPPGVAEQPQMLAMALSDPRLAALSSRYLDHRLARITLTLGFADNAEQGGQWMRDFLAERERYGAVTISGRILFNHELSQQLSDRLWLSLGWITGVTALVLMLVFRSLLIPLKAILVNVLGLLATLGVVAYMVQRGAFGLQAGELFILLPVLVFALVFGLSMDYEVLLISRIREAYFQSADNALATQQGLYNSARVVTSAALIMIVVAAAFSFTTIKPVQQLGVGIAFNVLLEATLLRLILVPGLMRLMGHWNWWPGNRQLLLSRRQGSATEQG